MPKRFVRFGLIVLSSLLVVVTVVALWYFHRPMLAATSRVLEPGIIYRRLVRTAPRPMIIHCVEVDLTQHHEFLMTPGTPTRKLPYDAQVTTEFLRRSGATVALSGDFFRPWHSTSPLDFYPHVGDPVETYGLAADRGTILCKGDPGRPSFFVSAEGVPSFDRPHVIFSAVSGDVLCVRRGMVRASYTDPYHTRPEPRAGIGLSRGRRTLFLVAIDGRQPNYSEGATVAEMASIMKELGVEDAMNLDGGGTVTLCHTSGVLNCPIDNRIPNRERPIANHIGVR